MVCTWYPAFWAKNPKWPCKEQILGRQKILSNRVEFGLKMIAETRRSRFIQYLPWFVHDFRRFGKKKTKMALQGANFGPSTNSLKSRRVWAQYRLNVKVIYGLVSKSLDSHCFCIRALVSPGGESWRCWKSNFSTDNFKRTNAKAFS